MVLSYDAEGFFGAVVDFGARSGAVLAEDAGVRGVFEDGFAGALDGAADFAGVLVAAVDAPFVAGVGADVVVAGFPGEASVAAGAVEGFAAGVVVAAGAAGGAAGGETGSAGVFAAAASVTE